MNYSKQAIAESKFIMAIQMVFGILIVYFSLLPIIVCIVDNSFGILIGFFFLFGIGIVLIVMAGNTSNLITQLKKYAEHLSIEPTGSIELLAAAMGTSQDIVLKNIQLMIQRKYIVNVYIDKETNCLKSALEGSQGNIQQKNVAEPITIICKNCGGVNKATIGRDCECEYCGSLIQAETFKH